MRIRLLTPLAKYLATEACDDITRSAIQVHGGLGFMAESVPGRLHLDAIITTIYEGTSEIQISFALKEVGKGALGVVFDEVGRDLAALTRPELAPYAERVRRGIEQVLAAGPALASDIGYALLSAQSLAESVISVVVAGRAAAPGRGGPRTLRHRGLVDRAAHGGPRGTHRADPRRLGEPHRALRADDRAGGARLSRPEPGRRRRRRGFQPW